MSIFEPAPPFPDVEQAFINRLAPLGGNSGTFVPDDVKSKFPFRFVQAFPGGIGPGQDAVTQRQGISVDILAANRAQGYPHAQLVVQRLIAAPWWVTVGATNQIVLIDSVELNEKPYEVPYGDEGIRRWVTSFIAEYRRPAV